MSSYAHFFSKNISAFAIFNDQSFNAMLTKDIISFELLGPDQYFRWAHFGLPIMLTTFYDFLFLCLEAKAILKRGLLQKERVSFLLEKTHLKRGLF